MVHIAPAGAWIETAYTGCQIQTDLSRLPRVRGLKLLEAVGAHLVPRGAPLAGCGLKRVRGGVIRFRLVRVFQGRGLLFLRGDVLVAKFSGY